MSHDPQVLHALELLKLHDDGHFGMPEAVVSARATLDAMREAKQEIAATWEPLRPGNVEQRLAEEMVGSGATPTAAALEAVVSEIYAAEHRQQAAELAVKVSRMAVELAEGRFVAAVAEQRDEIIIDHLRPALRETLEEVKALAEPLEGANLQAPESLLGDEKRGKAYLRLVAANRRHGAIREAQRHIAGGNLPEPAELALYRNAPEIWARAGLNWRSRRQFGKTPVPAHGLEALVWAATTPGVEVWIPTASEFEQLAEEIAATSRLRPAPTMVG